MTSLSSSSNLSSSTSSRPKCSGKATPTSDLSAVTTSMGASTVTSPSTLISYGTVMNTSSTASSSSKSYSVVPINGPSTETSREADGSPSATPSSEPFNPSAGSTETHQFVRTGYYNAAQQKAEGLMFLGNYGGQGSGNWTSAFGNTLSYINADGTGGASSPTIVNDTTLLSSHEATLLTDQPCDASCGYLQPGTIAYKGFAGPSKIFLLEFSMPHDTTVPQNPNTTPTTPPGNTTTTGTGNDQPAIWLLNARIPHTAQYHACNCWRTGCGELDVFEVLAPGGDRVSTSVHAAYAGPNGGGGGVGDANYFARPVDKDAPVRVACTLKHKRDNFRGCFSETMAPGLGSLPNETLALILGNFCAHCSKAHGPDNFPDDHSRLAEPQHDEDDEHDEREDSDKEPLWYSRTYRNTLYSMCLVSKRLQPVAQSVLYHEFVPGYGDPQHLHRISWGRRLSPFVRTIAARPDLAAVVKRAFVHFYVLRPVTEKEAQATLDEVIGPTAPEPYPTDAQLTVGGEDHDTYHFQPSEAIRHLRLHKTTLESLHLDLRGIGRPPTPYAGDERPLSETLRDFSSLRHVLLSVSMLCNHRGMASYTTDDSKLLTTLLPSTITSLHLAGTLGADTPRLARALLHLSKLAGEEFKTLRRVRCDTLLARDGLADYEIEEAFAASDVDFGFDSLPLSELPSSELTLSELPWSEGKRGFRSKALWPLEWDTWCPFFDEIDDF
ncbi:hypothetical protein NEMBOFW57_002649 [Staphylotrichum longicolle]|uniref:Cell wall protein YJL171C/Tos1 C-terminal domain-containing protein n=1 Tax=Staphylotrichum longicolle TaxID=669026 RepID=A0AAD4F4H3_9PEZI|nr:hypothetical protein NEMBOFW57_002649 [Staphylotrichum longicolle]